ncbi:class I SAM-dependent methyltransferase [Delftia sp. SD018]|uniref:class I SAM-dependent methyltransferase n=1 Tax=Delftia sp. SD018 TaxID=2781389 RepID=UPI001A95F78D|nr:class I SAM-dependent methyltransferase [Delftia sp. SD018]MBO1034249.1 class I SAM-dependent methyltransferase [Delftia sp. SD018]
MHIIKQAALAISSPLRLLIRHEIRKSPMPGNQDISSALQHLATLSTAEYVLSNLRGVDSETSEIDVLTKAIHSAEILNDKLVLEFGVFSGRTINHIAKYVNGQIHGFDSFEGLPERWRDGFKKGHFAVNGLPKVGHNVRLWKGWFHEALPEFLKTHGQDIALLHIDCDLYSSTKYVLTELSDRIKSGCVIVFDEYFNYPEWEHGEYKAFQEFISEQGLSYKYLCFNRFHEQVAVKIL